MLKTLVNRVMGTRFEREMKRLQPIVDEIKRHEERLAELSDDEIKSQTPKFRALIHERTHELAEEIERHLGAWGEAAHRLYLPFDLVEQAGSLHLGQDAFRRLQGGGNG